MTPKPTSMINITSGRAVMMDSNGHLGFGSKSDLDGLSERPLFVIVIYPSRDDFDRTSGKFFFVLFPFAS